MTRVKSRPTYNQLTISIELVCIQLTHFWFQMYQPQKRQHNNWLSVVFLVEYVCLWDVCGHKTSEFNEMVRHINYHAYHARLMAIGFNGRATLNLVRCKKDSSKRNQLPPLMSEHTCMWVGCEEKFNCVQVCNSWNGICFRFS